MHPATLKPHFGIRYCSQSVHVQKCSQGAQCVAKCGWQGLTQEYVGPLSGSPIEESSLVFGRT